MDYMPGPSDSDLLPFRDTAPPIFDSMFQEQLELLLKWRRDVRRFRRDPIDEELIAHMLDLAQLSPSVGNSQPWRWVRVETPALRAKIRENFETCNAKALADFDESRATAYAKLKLEGLDAAPLQLAVFCDGATTQGHGLGHRSMPEMLSYSVAGMLAILWLCARSQGLGMGWVSILDPAQVARTLEVPPSWQLVAYLCIGWPVEDHLDPELERHHWQERQGDSRRVIVK
ncbi:5,6-dimethylbenzimidazole synthase [Methyloferula stellata]|uniref:5,6-dimethylbenzimidazole synthase n=1 Tax=Methyloferula stellata TaxID=876270 RepID=UPI00036DAC7F|nr:5,6-dimethylbenzimidazole synthase [Methyloferula stellata]